MKILIAEDTEDSRIMLEMALAAQGYEVMSGTNGIEALHLMQTATPDLIIADIMMPEMDGFDLCRKVKADPNLKHIPFIFYTATYTDHRDEELAMALGAARFLIKPLEPKVLIQTIQEVLAAYQAEDAETIQATQSKEQEIDSMHLQSVGRKLDEKLVELEQERQALKKSEEKYRHLVEAIQDYYFFYTHDTEGIFTYLSPSIEIMLGYTPEEFLLHYSEYLTDSPINKEVEYHTQLSIKGEEQPPYEIELYHKNGSIHWLEVKEIPVFDQQGHVSHIDGIAHDITERIQAEKALRHGLKMDAIGQLTGGIAHDFNNILAIIMGNLDLLERVMPEGDKTLVQVKSMKKAGQRATDLTRQLLSFSRREPKQTTTTNINRVIKTMDSLIARSVTPEVELEYNLTDDLWLTRIDPGDFEDVLLNLSINARDAMASHGYLSIETRNVNIDAAYCEQKPEATPGEYVQLSVSDSGEGVPPELLERIFEPFYTTKGPGKGTGLGLAMVFGFTKRSGGFITCYSEVGVGSTFRLYLPRVKGEEQENIKTNGQRETLPCGTETILIVDDEIDLLDLTQTLLEELGYRVLTASDGKQALEQLAENMDIDLLFSDVIMPGGINGYELAEQVTNNLPIIKVLLTSGFTGKVLEHNGLARFDLLSKPYNQSELAKRVRAVLDGQEAR